MQTQTNARAVAVSLFGILLLFALLFASNASGRPAPGNDGPTEPGVTENTGEATFQIPIQLPPGPGGLVPNVTLRYSSRRGDGPYGVGWNLDLGEIHCSTRFGIPDYAYSNCDKFELDGQLLTRDGATHSYHTFVETFQKIDYLSASQSWEVIDPNGTIFRYGVDADARVMSGSDIARWLISEIEDPFGNRIFITYDDTTDVGTRYPQRITYGAAAWKGDGIRSVEFIYADRPDLIHDFAGGIERVLTKRLVDVKVLSYGNLVRRYAAGYDLPGVPYTTNRSRLSWVQQFGNDCPGVISGCVGLPRQTFEYTDSHDGEVGTPRQYSGFGKVIPHRIHEDPVDYGIPMAGNTWTNAVPVRIGDLNGDGLPDLIKGGYVFGDISAPVVEINTGSGFEENAAWTAAFLNLEIARPRAAFTQIKVDCSGGGCDSVYHDRFGPTAGISTAGYTTSTVKYPVGAVLPAAMTRPRAEFSTEARKIFHTGIAQEGWVEGIGRLFLSDVNADGLADIVVSVRLGGASIVANSDGTPIESSAVSRGASEVVQMVYRNTGDPGNPAGAWVEDEELAAGLPPFGVVHFESGFGAELAIPFGLTTGEEIIFRVEFDNELPAAGNPCTVRGLNGLWPTPVVGVSPDVCLSYVNLDPRFQDFNGDGFVDLMVLELDDPEALYQGYMDRDNYTLYDRGSDADFLPDNHATSKVWIQDPSAAGTVNDPRWVRAPQFDLPQVDFQSLGSGGNAWTNGLFPLAHSQPVLQSPLTNRPATSRCPSPSGMPNWEFCAPMTHNVNLGVKLADLNRDGLTDVIWSRYLAGGVWPNDTRFLIAQGVLLNTGVGWCSSVQEMEIHFGGAACPDANIYYPPDSSSPDPATKPSGFALQDQEYAGYPTGYLTDLNADGFLDYVQAHTLPYVPGNAAWLFDPAAGAAPSRWVRDNRYDLDIDYNLINFEFSDSAGFVVLDVNGDGTADIVGDDLRADGWARPQAFISGSYRSDLLRLVDNGRGGKVALSYESAILQRDSDPLGLELEATEHASTTGESLNGTTIADVVRWTATQVVSDIRIAGPNREPEYIEDEPGWEFGPPTTYQYAHPRYCVESRSNLGFRIVERTLPAGEVVKSRFYQVHGRAGRASSVLVSDDGVDMHLYEEVWEIQPEVPALVPGSIDHPDVHLGRLAEIRSMNLYGSQAAGAERSRVLYYDDNYGYNFVERAVEIRPTGTLVSLRIPAFDAPNSIFGLLREEKIFDHVGAGLSDLDFTKHALFGYQRGRPSARIDMVKARGDAGSGTVEVHTMTYDAYGNLTKEIVHAPTGNRVTDFCYDGDHSGGEDAGWCPDFGQDSHSVRIGLMDDIGGVTVFRPDDGTGTILETRSSYADEPSRRMTLDRFGRPFESFVRDGTGWLKTSKTIHDEFSLPRVVERYDYPRVGSTDADAIWSSVVYDGFGGTWKEIGETPSGFAATLTYHDPATRTFRKSLPIECPGQLCTGLSGEFQPAARMVQLDPIGRPFRNDTPDGFSIFSYGPITKTGGPGATGILFDAILEKNGKGDLIRRAMDGNRIGWLEECGNTALPTTTNISSTPCGGPGHTRTYYTYEATGEIETIYDARAGSPFNDPEHFLRYHYDTLGRVLQIDDPALAGSGHSLTNYDTYGNIQTVINARSQQRRHTYDRLNRLTAITTPADETDYTLSYRQNERQPSGDSSDDYQRTIIYDELGRVQQEDMAVRNAYGYLQSFYTDYTYDLIGRVTEILHPAKHYDFFGWKNTIVRYEYDGGYLDQVCELGNASDCDSAATKFVTSIGFDSLGRRQSMSFAGGVRSFQYAADTHRLEQDSFDSSTYQYTRNYADYDEIGNILSITGSESAAHALDMNETYVYDERNRISQWTKEGTAYGYAYDDLGNLIHRAGDTQIYNDSTRPHAIQRRNLFSPTPTVYAYDDDGNVESILGEDSQYFVFDSANRLICLSASNSRCDTRVAYDVNGKRVAEYPSGGQAFNAYIGDAFLYQHVQVVAHASVEVMIDGERIALKRFNPQLRSANASLFVFHIPTPWILGGVGCVGLLVLILAARSGALVLLEVRPLRAATAFTAASSLLFPSIATAALPSSISAPSYLWEISDPLGTGMVLIDVNGDRVRHQTFTPFGRVHDEVGANIRTFYAGHRRNNDSGMFYMQARWYDPGSGRFLSIDPLIRSVATPQSANPYSYTENNPVNGVDPTGMFLDSAAAAAALATSDSDREAEGGEGDSAGGGIPDPTAPTGGTAGPIGPNPTSPSQGGTGGGSNPWQGVEEFTPVKGEGPASHSPAQLASLFSGVEQFPTVTPNSFANFMNLMMSGGLALSASPASLPVRPSPSSSQTLARNNAAFMSGMLSGGLNVSTLIGLQGAAYLGIGLYSIGIGLTIMGTGGLAAIPLGFHGATVLGASASGAFVLGTGFTAIGAANLTAAGALRRGGQ